MSGTLIIANTTQQAVTLLVITGVMVAFALVMPRRGDSEAMKPLGALLSLVFFGWMSANMMTSSTRLDAEGVAFHAPLHPLKYSTAISWNDVMAAEIIPCGWYTQGLRLAGRNGAEIIIPLDEMRPQDIAPLIARIAAHPSIRMYPDSAALFDKAQRIVPTTKSLQLRATVIPDRVASAAR